MKKHFLLTVISLFAITAFAAVGPQSVKVTFNDGMTTGWAVSNSGSMNAADGLLNVTMGVQNAEENKYRADIDHKTPGTFTFDKTKDVIWAIKLSAAFVGNLSFEFEYVNSESGNTYISQSNIKSTLSCADGGTIYYTDFSSKYGAVQDGTVTINVIRFKMADAVFADAADAHYSVDWIASFASVNDLKSFQDWTDEAQEADASLPYLELCFRPKADGSGYDKRGNGFGTRYDDQQFEGNYQARFFAVEYFLIEDFSAEKIYTLALTTTGSGGTDALSVWNFPYQVNYETSASDMNTNATAVVGYAPGTTGSMNTPIATSTCNENVWSFSIPADKLTALATIGTKTLVGVLVTSNVHDADKKGKFASASHASIDHPSLTYTRTAPIFNTTQSKQEPSLSEAVSNANAGDVITLFNDVTISGGRLDIAKSLTIQSATGAEKIICGVAANSIMVLANGEGDEHTVTLKNLVIDGDNVSRSKQTLEAAQNANICLDGVQFVNTAYSEVTGDVKNTGNKNIILKGTNVIPNGIYLNMNKRVKHEGATHTSPIKIVLANDYVPETYSIVLTCSDPTLYTAELANGTAWQLFKKDTQNELAGRTMPAHSYDLTVTAAGMATLVLGYDCPIPDGMKAYKLTNEGEADIYAKEQTSIKKNEPVLIIADADTYTFTSAVGVRLDEQADPVSGCLRGTYSESPVAVLNNDGAGTYNYILTKVGEEVGFFHANSDGTNKVSKNHAYLFTTYNATGMASAPKMRIVFHDQTATGIEDMPSADKAEKLLIDGVIYIRKADHLYRIDGQLVK